MPLFETDGASINFETIGEAGPWVTLLNGHTRSSSDFRMMARVLTETGLLRVLLLDNRGAGKSVVTRPFIIQDMCNDVVLLWDKLRIETSHLLGISMGGFIAQGVAINFPERVDKLVLISTAPDESFIHPTGGGWISEGGQLEEKMRAYFAPGFVERNPVLFKTMVSQIKQSIDSGRFSKLSDMQRDALRGAKWTNELRKIRAKTLVVHGEMDQVVDIKGAQALASGIEKANLTVFPGVGHLLLAEAPKELYRATSIFLMDS